MLKNIVFFIAFFKTGSENLFFLPDARLIFWKKSHNPFNDIFNIKTTTTFLVLQKKFIFKSIE
jgi:hypothetical protein